MVGKVQTYNEIRGFGFLLQDFRTKIFFHVHQWKSNTPPRVGMMVTFDVVPSGKAGFKNQAANVRPIETGLTSDEAEEFVNALNGGAQ